MELPRKENQYEENRGWREEPGAKKEERKTPGVSHPATHTVMQ